MRLTQTVRQAFVRAVMDDVPEINYQDQAKKVVMADAESQLPAAIREAWKDPASAVFINSCYCGMPYGLSSIGGVPRARGTDFKLSQKASSEVKAIAELAQAQKKTRAELKAKIEAVAESATTSKKLAELLPELAKYMPPDQETLAKANLPALADVVPSLTAAGWPKGGKKQVRAK